MPDLTLTEAARRLGYSADTMLLRDAGRKTNQGHWRVCLSDDQIARHRKPSLSQPGPPQVPPASAGPSQPPSPESSRSGEAEGVLRERIAGLEQRLADRDAENARLRTALAHQAEAHRAQLAAQADQHRAELLVLLERAAVRPGLLECLLTVVLPNRS